MNFNTNGVATSFETGKRIGAYDGNLTSPGGNLNTRRILIKCVAGSALVGHPVNGLTGVQEVSAFPLAAGESVELFVTGVVRVKVPDGSAIAYVIESYKTYNYQIV